MSYPRALATILTLASLAVACDLNPQPLPPGDQPDGSLNDNGGGTTSGSGSGGSSSSGSSSGSGSGGGSSDAGTTTGLPSGADGGSSRDAAADATSDGASDATLDSGETFDAEAGSLLDAADAD